MSRAHARLTRQSCATRLVAETKLDDAELRGRLWQGGKAAVDASLDTRGVALLIEAEHTCMSMRGVKKDGISTVTTQFTGVFRSQPNEQARFLSLLRAAR